MRALLFTSIVLVGCMKQNPDFCPAHPDDPRCGGGGDGGNGADADSGSTIDARLSFGSGAYAILLTAGAMGTVTFTGAPLDTDATMLCLPTQVWVNTNQPDACFVVAANITVGSTSLLQVTGSRPLVLLASDKITIAGTLDVASHLGAATGGPGTPDPACTAGTAPGTDSSGGGGGAGGTFIGKGGNGGGGNGANNGGAAANAPITSPMYLRAGCSGQNGAAGGGGGEGGHGGGAVYLIAGNEINLSGGRVNASGAAGSTGSTRGGGGGGGSGGMIVLAATTITTDDNTIMIANGGGGAGGANTGSAGSDPVLSTPLVGGLGGTTGGGCGTNTGGGGQASNAVGPGGPGPSNCGGGGGGGGIGLIQSSAIPAKGTYSPMPMLLQ